MSKTLYEALVIIVGLIILILIVYGVWLSVTTPFDEWDEPDDDKD